MMELGPKELGGKSTDLEKAHGVNSKDGKSPPLDPAHPGSYRGIVLADVLPMFFQKLLCDRLSTFSELHNLSTSQQSCAQPHRQPLDTVYTLISYIQHNHDIHKTFTYVFFGDLQTVFPSIFKQQLLIRLAHYGITG